jgi:hypothetical protein
VPFPKATRTLIAEYVTRHLPNQSWYEEFFSFVSDRRLRQRLAREYESARALYKVLEGAQAKGVLKRAQVKVQVLQYASLYEAVLHYVLFVKYRSHPEVRKLARGQRRIEVSISPDIWARIEKATHFVRKELRVQRVRPDNADLTKIRFDSKVAVAQLIGLIHPPLSKDLVEIYSARNAIHLHAEIRKGLRYQMALSMRAYRRLQPFRAQIYQKLLDDGKLKLGRDLRA